jgi:hypothetical protein
MTFIGETFEYSEQEEEQLVRVEAAALVEILSAGADLHQAEATDKEVVAEHLDTAEAYIDDALKNKGLDFTKKVINETINILSVTKELGVADSTTDKQTKFLVKKLEQISALHL